MRDIGNKKVSFESTNRRPSNAEFDLMRGQFEDLGSGPVAWPSDWKTIQDLMRKGIFAFLIGWGIFVPIWFFTHMSILRFSLTAFDFTVVFTFILESIGACLGAGALVIYFIMWLFKIGDFEENE